MNVCKFGFSLSLISGHSKPAFELAHYLMKDGVNVKILSSELNEKYNLLHQQLLKEEHISVEDHRPFKSIFDFVISGANEDVRAILSWADIIHVYGPQSLFLLQKYAPFTAKIVLSINSTFKVYLKDLIKSGLSSLKNLVSPSYLSSMLPDKFFSSTLSKADAIICWTKFMQEQVRFLNIPSPSFIPVGVNFDGNKFVENTIDGDFIFLYLGYLASARGVTDLLDAFEIVNHKWPSTRLVVAHTGLHPTEQDMFLKRINRSKARESIEILGFAANLSEIINKANVIVLPFRTYVGYSQPPLTVLEALAHGRPVISTKTGCIPELISNEFNGFCVTPSNPALLSEYMLKMREMDLPSMSKNAREYAESHHDWKKICKSTLNIYNRVLSEN